VAGQPLVPYLVVLHLVPDRHRCRSTWRRRGEPGPALLGGGAGPAAIKKSYVETAQNASANNSIVTLLEALGLLVVGIALIGLVGTLTLALIERTREVGILRCLGASARQIRRVFNTEAVVMATAGWALGSLLGYVLFLGLIAFVEDEFGFTVAKVFPVASLPVALVAAVFVTLIVVRPTLRRAVRSIPDAPCVTNRPGLNTTHAAFTALCASHCKYPEQIYRPDPHRCWHWHVSAGAACQGGAQVMNRSAAVTSIPISTAPREGALSRREIAVAASPRRMGQLRPFHRSPAISVMTSAASSTGASSEMARLARTGSSCWPSTAGPAAFRAKLAAATAMIAIHRPARITYSPAGNRPAR